MLRVRIDGGELSLAQLRAIAEISSEFGRDSRRHHRPAEHPAALDPRRGRAGDLAPARGGRPADHRGVRRLPAGRARQPGRRRLARRGASTRPRRSTRSSSATSATRGTRTCRASSRPRSPGWPTRRTRRTTSRFIGVVHPEHGPGFDLWVGGGLSTNPRLAERLGVWVPLDEIPDVWEGVVGIFRDYGYRRLRHRARLKFLLADWGVAKFREVLEKEYLGRALIDGPAPELPDKPIDHIGVHKQRDGRNYVGAAPVVGPLLRHPARPSWPTSSRRHGSDRVRLTPYQKLLVLDVADDQVEAAGRGPARDRAGGPAVGLAARHDGLHRHRVLQARDRRDQGPRRGAGGPARGAARATSTPTSRSTSTAAPTPAPAPRSPTSASRASWS